jgi:hypothetical protein
MNHGEKGEVVFQKKNIIKEIFPWLGISLGYWVVEKNFLFNTV